MNKSPSFSLALRAQLLLVIAAGCSSDDSNYRAAYGEFTSPAESDRGFAQPPSVPRCQLSWERSSQNPSRSATRLGRLTEPYSSTVRELNRSRVVRSRVMIRSPWADALAYA